MLLHLGSRHQGLVGQSDDGPVQTVILFRYRLGHQSPPRDGTESWYRQGSAVTLSGR